MTSNFAPCPKLRVTLRICTPSRPQTAQLELGDIDGDDNKPARWAKFDGCFSGATFEREPADEKLDFAGLRVALALDDFTREDDAFKIEDRKVVIVQLFGGMQGNDVAQ